MGPAGAGQTFSVPADPSSNFQPGLTDVELQQTGSFDVVIKGQNILVGTALELRVTDVHGSVTTVPGIFGLDPTDPGGVEAVLPVELGATVYSMQARAILGP